MAIKLSTTCTRCHREDIHEVETLATATAFEALQKKKEATLAKLEAFIASLPKDELPDLYVLLNGKSLVHSYLCDPETEEGKAEGKGKRSCAKRVNDLMEDATELGPRAPRTKKVKTEAVEPPTAE